MRDGFVGEQEVLQFLVEGWVLAAYPLEHHRGMFFFLIPVVSQNCRKVGIFAGIDPLVVLVDRFQFFH